MNQSVVTATDLVGSETTHAKHIMYSIGIIIPNHVYIYINILYIYIKKQTWEFQDPKMKVLEQKVIYVFLT